MEESVAFLRRFLPRAGCRGACRPRQDRDGMPPRLFEVASGCALWLWTLWPFCQVSLSALLGVVAPPGLLVSLATIPAAAPAAACSTPGTLWPRGGGSRRHSERAWVEIPQVSAMPNGRFSFAYALVLICVALFCRVVLLFLAPLHVTFVPQLGYAYKGFLLFPN